MRNVALDYIRVVSILYIVGFWHLQAYGHAEPWIEATPFFHYITVMALALFVFISGLLLGGKTLDTAASIREFYVSRFFTIYLPFVLATVAFIILHLQPTLILLKGILLVGMISEPPPNTLWFANMIVLFYLITPALVQLRVRLPLYVALAAVIFAVLSVAEYLTGRIDGRMMIYFPVYALGIALGQHRLKQNSTIAVGGVIAMVGVFLAGGLPADAVETSPLMVLWSTGSALCVTSALFIAGSTWREKRVLTFLATASLFMYLLHRPLYAILVGRLGVSSPWGITALLLFVGLPILIVISYYLQKIYTQCVSSATARVRLSA